MPGINVGLTSTAFNTSPEYDALQVLFTDSIENSLSTPLTSSIFLLAECWCVCALRQSQLRFAASSELRRMVITPGERLGESTQANGEYYNTRANLLLALSPFAADYLLSLSTPPAALSTANVASTLMR